MNERLLAARALLETLTPLRIDCGTTCGHRCCASVEGEETGMLLFPGEESYYEGLEGYVIRPSALGSLLICSGRCNRCDRPLSCRLFPLLPVVREDGVKVTVDLRAKAVCPLAQQGKASMSVEFADAVRQAGRFLAEDDVLRAFLVQLTRQQDELRALRRQFGGNSHV